MHSAHNIKFTFKYTTTLLTTNFSTLTYIKAMNVNKPKT